MKSTFILILVGILTTSVQSQDFTLLKDHSENSVNGISTNYNVGVSSSDNLFYYLARIPNSNNFAIYSTDGTPEGTIRRYTTDASARSMVVVDGVIFVADIDNKIYSIRNGNLKLRKILLNDFNSMYPVKGGALVFEDQGFNENKIYFISGTSTASNSLGTWNTYESVITSQLGERFISSDQGTSNTSERTIISKGTGGTTKLVSEYLKDKGLGTFHSISTAIAIDDYLLIDAKVTSSSFSDKYLINVESDNSKKLSISSTIRSFDKLGQNLIIRTLSNLYSYNIDNEELVTLSSDIAFNSDLYFMNDEVFYFDDIQNAEGEYALIHSDGSTTLNEPFADIKSTSIDLFKILEIGNDFVVINRDEDFQISIYRTETNEWDEITDLSFVGSDFFIGKVRGQVIFSKYTDEFGLEFYRSDKIIDNDNDGYLSDVDCNEENADINPGAEEILDNDIDENCDGAILTAVNETSKKESSVYPIPSSTNVFLKNVDLKNNDVRLITIDGKLLSRINDQSIDISHLQSGMYYLEIRNKNTSKAEYLRFIKE